MKGTAIITAAFSALLVLTACQTTTVNEPTEPHIVIHSKQANQLINESSAIEVLGDGYHWSEGPVWVPKLNALLFSDVPNNIIYQWRPGVGVTEYLRPSGSTGIHLDASGQGSNGLMLDLNGQLILCQHGDRRVARMAAPLDQPAAEFQTLASLYQGKRFNSPNDLAQSKDGTIWFTDPPYGLPKGQTDTAHKELDYHGVFRLDMNGDVRLVHQHLTRPNGVALSPDDKTLYVANSDDKFAVWKAWDIQTDGNLANERVLFDATPLTATGPGKPDGLKVHPSGVLFATGPGGVLLISPTGEHLATIRTITPSANVAFNSDYSILFITSANRLLKVELLP
ncbi:SMP-30/gluconolactonase/LRE family protein [Neiella marina]|uniref:SMP-30/gluconolactonase/LRE family protein n=1 Tax=Neiella holothuriorum TaxID=2870530 RepID=A0ABS7ECT9_9GAMM|nr:SMP-30/gluconolactonase/LRE family protein [Neiella holothuriorum]MBW8190149.1 SMP-30/gluconolactonase/LRE family protein [Neiella holothuriorum]